MTFACAKCEDAEDLTARRVARKRVKGAISECRESGSALSLNRLFKNLDFHLPFLQAAPFLANCLWLDLRVSAFAVLSAHES